MKNIILLATLMTVLSCKAQSPIISLSDHTAELVDNAYYKDIDGDLDNFVGTWIYTNGTSSIKVTFQKIEQVFNDEWYEDLLIGEYQYIENGVEKVNTLNNTPSDVYEHSISGCRIIYKGQYPNCTFLEKRVFLSFYDPDPNLNYISSAFTIRYIDDGSGVEKLEAQLVSNGTKVLPYSGAPIEPTVPYGNYIMTKQ